MSVEYSILSIENRIPISLRLPAKMVDAVQKYADDNSLKKTDAYIYFLQLGLMQQAEMEESGSLEQVESLLEKALSIVQIQKSAQ